MIKIDDAGTGSNFGKGIIVVCREETGEYIYNEINDNKKIFSYCIESLNNLNVDKNEPIVICRGNVFKGTFNQLLSMGYNIEKGVIDGKVQDLAEDLFAKQLYSLGFSKEIKLNGKDYRDFEYNLANFLYFNPKLKKTIRNDSLKKNKMIKEIIRKIDRLENEFPNLYEKLIS